MLNILEIGSSINYVNKGFNSFVCILQTLVDAPLWAIHIHMVFKLGFLTPSPHVDAFQIADVVFFLDFFYTPPPLVIYMVCGCPLIVISNWLTEHIIIARTLKLNYTQVSKAANNKKVQK